MRITLETGEYYAYTAAREPDPERANVVFVHGTAMDHTVWALQSRYFAYHGYNILAVDLPGHGHSAGNPMTSIEQYGNWLIALLNTVSGTGCHLVGHSMGALICLQAASVAGAAGNPVASLALVGFSYPMTVTPALLDAAQHRPSEAYAMMTQWSHTSPLGGEPNPGFWSVGSQMSLMENSRSGAVFTDLTACNNYQAGALAFETLHCRQLFISGAQDRMAPCKLAQAEAARNPEAEICILPRCGHSIMSENPDGVRDALNDFIQRNR